MPVSTANLMQSVYDLFSGIYASSGGRGAALAFEKLGVPLSDSMFKLAETDHQLSPALAIERLSEIAGVVLEMDGNSVNRSIRTVEGMTEFMLQQSLPVNADATAALGAAKTSDAKNFDVTRASLEGQFQFHPVYASPVDWYDSAAAIWSPHTIETRMEQKTVTQGNPHPVEGSSLNWRVLRTDLRPALERPVTAAHPLMAMTQTEQPPMAEAGQASNAARVPLATRPFLRMASPVVAAPPKLNLATLQAVRPAAGPRVPSAMATMPNGQARPAAMMIRTLPLARIAAHVSANSMLRQVHTEGLHVSFEHCIVTLNWPWFPKTLTLLRNWYVPGYERGAFSNGVGAGDTGLMPVLTCGFVAIRKLTISANWAKEDLDVVQGSASVGPFCLVGRSFDAASGMLSCPGMQIIGWFCEALPVLPPLSDPELSSTVASSSLTAANLAPAAATPDGSTTPLTELSAPASDAVAVNPGVTQT